MTLYETVVGFQCVVNLSLNLVDNRGVPVKIKDFCNIPQVRYVAWLERVGIIYSIHKCIEECTACENFVIYSFLILSQSSKYCQFSREIRRYSYYFIFKGLTRLRNN